MTAIEREKRYTSDEFLAMTDLPENCELIDGYIYMSPSPNQDHQTIVLRAAGKIDAYVRNHSGKCKTLIAPSDVKLSDRCNIQPDIFVVCDPDKLDGQRCNGAPDWVIEILSPSNETHDLKDKLYLYKEAGVREYWIVDPMQERVIVYPFTTTKITGIYTFDDDIPAGIYSDAAEPLSICIGKLLKG